MTRLPVGLEDGLLCALLQSAGGGGMGGQEQVGRGGVWGWGGLLLRHVADPAPPPQTGTGCRSLGGWRSCRTASPAA